MKTGKLRMSNLNSIEFKDEFKEINLSSPSKAGNSKFMLSKNL
jgi:hypothetical protein